MDTAIGWHNLLDPDLYQTRFFQNFFPMPASNAWPMGTLLPDFELPDMTGERTVQLASIQRPVVLAFTRIFTQRTVCPLCSPHIKALNDRYGEFRDRGIELLLIASLDPAESQHFVRALGLQVPFLSDPNCQVFRTYQTGQALGAPLPAQFIRAANGSLRYRHCFSFLDPNASVDRLLDAASLEASGF